MSRRRWRVQTRQYASVEALKAPVLAHPATVHVKDAQKAILLRSRRSERRSKHRAKRFEEVPFIEPSEPEGLRWRGFFGTVVGA